MATQEAGPPDAPDWGFVAAAALTVVLTASCGPAEPSDGQLYTVAYAGDLVVGRRVNSFIEEHGIAAPLAGVSETLSRADLTIVNLESIIASGGVMAEKGSWGLVHYRGRPETVGILTAAGVDVAALANNHALDYGPEALFEGMSILRRAGISDVGAGKNLDEAMRPVFHVLGDTVVGVIAVHTTQARFGATQKKPGNNFVSVSEPDDLVRRVREQVERAREHAHLVLLVIHWGELRSTAPSKAQRELARRFVEEAGIDGLLGSGRHLLMGVELIDGRPIIYDVGNLILDFTGTAFMNGEESRSGIFELQLNRGGIRRLGVTPIRLSFCKADLARGEVRDEILGRFAKDSQEFGTRVAIESGRALIDIDERYSPAKPSKPFTPEPPVAPHVPEPNSYPPKVVVGELPETATARHATSDAGIEMLGFEISREIERGQGVRLTVYWRALAPVPESYSVFVEVTPEKPEGSRWRGDHTPGGWAYPTTWWKPGQIVRDTILVRCPWPPDRISAGSHELSVGLTGRRGKVSWTDGGGGSRAETRVYLGKFDVK